ncbi:STAS domain-containing protein [Streptomyces sp. NPDC059819]|uniref:STAS domain-containing protein n=1 Tax=Streptomyces sp. NPDC059819 TaxID=3346963 RepID=UPI00364D3C2C
MTVTVLEDLGGSHGQHAALHVCGEVDYESSPQLAAALKRSLDRHPVALAVGLEGVTFCDCSGLNVLLAARRRAAREGTVLCVTGLSAPVDRLFTVAASKVSWD